MYPSFVSSDDYSIEANTEKQALEFQLKLIEHNLKGADLATREQPTSEIVKLRTALQNLKLPNNNLNALQTRLSFLQQQLHLSKRHKVVWLCELEGMRKKRFAAWRSSGILAQKFNRRTALETTTKLSYEALHPPLRQTAYWQVFILLVQLSQRNIL